jgi:hypothetical protein
LNQIELNYRCRHASHFYSFLILYYIGKSDPDGKKAGDTVDMKVVNRLIIFLNGHYPGAYPEDKMIEFLTPFIGREEAVLQLTMLLYQNGVEDSAEIVTIMNAFPAGKEDEMHAYVHTQLKKKKELDAAAAAAAAAIPTKPSVARSSLAAAAAVAKNTPTPVEYGPVDLDVDEEVYGDDDYMPPADASGNKRGLEVEK